jgi:hypothetical protein
MLSVLEFSPRVVAMMCSNFMLGVGLSFCFFIIFEKWGAKRAVSIAVGTKMERWGNNGLDKPRKSQDFSRKGR